MEIQEGLFAFRGFQIDIASLAAVAAIGATPRDVLFTAEADATPAPIAGLHTDGYFIDKAHGPAGAIAEN
jgi:hypothetical protein